jgi:hypothetical protein
VHKLLSKLPPNVSNSTPLYLIVSLTDEFDKYDTVDM